MLTRLKSQIKSWQENQRVKSRAAKSRRARRRIFVDCGANTCTALRGFIEKYPDFEFFAFEPQPELYEHGLSVMADHPKQRILWYPKAVWTEDCTLNFYLATEWGDNHRGASTLVENHTHNGGKVDYGNPVEVEAIDFSVWLSCLARPEDYVIVKMDIEGAEYPVLEQLIEDDHIGLIDELLIEWHWQMNPDISQERHEALVRKLRESVDLQKWY